MLASIVTGAGCMQLRLSLPALFLVVVSARIDSDNRSGDKARSLKKPFKFEPLSKRTPWQWSSRLARLQRPTTDVSQFQTPYTSRIYGASALPFKVPPSIPLFFNAPVPGAYKPPMGMRQLAVSSPRRTLRNDSSTSSSDEVKSGLRAGARLVETTVIQSKSLSLDTGPVSDKTPRPRDNLRAERRQTVKKSASVITAAPDIPLQLLNLGSVPRVQPADVCFTMFSQCVVGHTSPIGVLERVDPQRCAKLCVELNSNGGRCATFNYHRPTGLCNLFEDRVRFIPGRTFPSPYFDLYEMDLKCEPAARRAAIQHTGEFGPPTGNTRPSPATSYKSNSTPSTTAAPSGGGYATVSRAPRTTTTMTTTSSTTAVAQLTACPENFRALFTYVIGWELGAPLGKTLLGLTEMQCVDNCVTDQTDTFQCESMDYQIELETCYLMPEASLPTGRRQLNENEDSTYIEKVCIAEGTAARCPENVSLERFTGFQLVSFEAQKTSTPTMRLCLELCLDSLKNFGFVCESINFFYTSETDLSENCVLNTADHLSQPNFFFKEEVEKVDYISTSQCTDGGFTSEILAANKARAYEIGLAVAKRRDGGKQKEITRLLYDTTNHFAPMMDFSKLPLDRKVIALLLNCACRCALTLWREGRHIAEMHQSASHAQIAGQKNNGSDEKVKMLRPDGDVDEEHCVMCIAEKTAGSDKSKSSTGTPSPLPVPIRKLDGTDFHAYLHAPVDGRLLVDHNCTKTETVGTAATGAPTDIDDGKRTAAAAPPAAPSTPQTAERHNGSPSWRRARDPPRNGKLKPKLNKSTLA